MQHNNNLTTLVSVVHLANLVEAKQGRIEVVARTRHANSINIIFNIDLTNPDAITQQGAMVGFVDLAALSFYPAMGTVRASCLLPCVAYYARQIMYAYTQAERGKEYIRTALADTFKPTGISVSTVWVERADTPIKELSDIEVLTIKITPERFSNVKES